MRRGHSRTYVGSASKRRPPPRVTVFRRRPARPARSCAAWRPKAAATQGIDSGHIYTGDKGDPTKTYNGPLRTSQDVHRRRADGQRRRAPRATSSATRWAVTSPPAVNDEGPFADPTMRIFAARAGATEPDVSVVDQASRVLRQAPQPPSSPAAGAGVVGLAMLTRSRHKTTAAAGGGCRRHPPHPSRSAHRPTPTAPSPTTCTTRLQPQLESAQANATAGDAHLQAEIAALQKSKPDADRADQPDPQEKEEEAGAGARKNKKRPVPKKVAEESRSRAAPDGHPQPVFNPHPPTPAGRHDDAVPR